MSNKRISRRDALRATSAALLGLAGCTSGDPDQTATETGSPTPTPGDIGADTIDFSVEIVQQFTSEHPARFRASITNRSSQQVTVSGLGPAGIIMDHRVSNASGDGHLDIFPPDPEYIRLADSEGNTLDTPVVPETQIDGCWQTHDYAALSVNPIAFVVGLDPGDTEADEYVVLDGSDSGCLHAGRYEVQNPSSLTLSGGLPSESTSESGVDLTLGCTIRLKADHTVTVSDSSVWEATAAESDR